MTGAQVADLVVTDAQPGEGPLVGALLRRAIDARHLAISIFSHSYSDEHLERLLAAPPAKRRTQVRVARDGTSITACALSSGGSSCHLEYIAVDPRQEGRGTGGTLLKDFEMMKATSHTLDVFASNTWAWGWYQRHGYTEQWRDPVQIIDVKRVASGASLGYFHPDLSQVEFMVSQDGYCSVEFSRESGRELSVSLYGRTHLRVRSTGGPTVQEVVSIAREHFPSRTEIVLLGDFGEHDFPLVLEDELLRLSKNRLGLKEDSVHEST
jgi:ribosomal protein S18 acetylase RimI-like enzyme